MKQVPDATATEFVQPATGVRVDRLLDVARDSVTVPDSVVSACHAELEKLGFSGWGRQSQGLVLSFFHDPLGILPPDEVPSQKKGKKRKEEEWWSGFLPVFDLPTKDGIFLPESARPLAAHPHPSSLETCGAIVGEP